MMLSLVHRMSLSPRRLAAHRRCAPSPYRTAKIDPSSRVYTVTPWIGGAVFAERREYSRIILELRLPFFGDLRPLRQSEISGAATDKSTGMGTLYSVGSKLCVLALAQLPSILSPLLFLCSGNPRWAGIGCIEIRGQFVLLYQGRQLILGSRPSFLDVFASLKIFTLLTPA